MRHVPSRIALLVVLLVALPVASASALSAVSKPRWLTKVVPTEYYPAPEKWVVGARVDARGLARQARVAGLYAGRGLSV